MRVFSLFIFAALFCGAATAEKSPYFAYFEMPARGANSSSYFIFLSKEPCPDPKAQKDGWMVATFDYPKTRGKVAACWGNYKKPKYGIDMHLCWLTPETNKFDNGNFCMDARSSMFISTESLPKPAKF